MKLSRKSTSALVLSHFLLNPFDNQGAASTALRQYLADKTKDVAQIELPFPESKEGFSYAKLFGNKTLLKAYKVKNYKLPYWLQYVFDPLVVFYYLVRIRKKYDICVACDNLSFLTIFFLKKMGFVKKLIYYSIDYTDKRFTNPIMNRLYYAVDRFACMHSTANWVVSKEMIEGRKKGGMNIKKCSPFMIVPIGFRLSEIKIKNSKQVNLNNLVFCGTLRTSAGVEVALCALSVVLKKLPKTNLTFVGGGELEQSLRNLARKLKVEKAVKILGRVPKHKDVVNHLLGGSVGLAPYRPVENSISKYSDPGKIKLYLACGLPVITTEFATTSKLLLENHAGLVADYTCQDLADKIIYLIEKRSRYERYRKNVEKLRKRFGVDLIFEESFKALGRQCC